MRRKNAIDAINNIFEWESYLTETRTPINETGDAEHGARAAQLRNCFPYLQSIGVVHVACETRAMSQTNQNFSNRKATLDSKDTLVLKKLRQQKRIQPNLRLEHIDKKEPLLKIADLLASSRTDLLYAKDEAIYPRIGHRVTILSN